MKSCTAALRGAIFAVVVVCAYCLPTTATIMLAEWLSGMVWPMVGQGAGVDLE